MSKIYDFQEFKRKRDGKPEPLLVTPDGKITTKSDLDKKQADFQDHKDKIRTSMDKITRLMKELAEFTNQNDSGINRTDK